LLTQDKVKWLHVELSSRCNAWCPACPRNKFGFGLADGLVEQDLPTARLEEILQSLPAIETVQFCGTNGDPIIAKNVLEAIEVSKKYAKKIQIHTNGSLRNQDWWTDLAHMLGDIDHDVWFGIDGIGSVHEVYRQGTDYEKIISNASAFIQAGGHATWQFIPYAHNEHQVRECFALSQRLQFKKFKLAKLYRSQKRAQHWKTGEPFELLPPAEFQPLLRMPMESTHVDPGNCMHLSYPSIYLAADGTVSRCCYLEELEDFEKFNSIEELLHTQVDTNNKSCLRSCGS
jgi:hypothetical protein